jgi:hypothetical protein
MKRIHLMAMGTLALALAACAAERGESVGTDRAALSGCGLDCPDPGDGTIDPPPEPTSTSTSTSTSPPPPPPPTPVSAVPAGLDGGLAYIYAKKQIWSRGDIDWAVRFNGSLKGKLTLDVVGGGASSDSYSALCQSDAGLYAWAGFCNQQRTTFDGAINDLTKSTLFALPPGTACGFHHTQYRPASSYGAISECMGLDPASHMCPSGWRLRHHFDMSSGDGLADCSDPANLNSPHCGYYVWCEYLDPNNFCPVGSACEQAVAQDGYTIGLHSDVDPYGAGLRGTACPAGTYRSSYYDDGRGTGEGLSGCIR